jgi:hypothetical protein
MATFPALVPASRTFTAATYPGAVQLAYGGQESRVRTSNAQTGARFRFAFSALTEAEMLSIRDHYYGQRGRFSPFQLSTALLSGMADPSAVTPAGYQWIYVGSPKVTDLPAGTAAARSCRHDVELELEMVPEVSALASGANWVALAAIAGGAADDGEIRLPGAAWAMTAAMAGGAATAGASLDGAAWSASAAIAGGEAASSLLLHMNGTNGSTTFIDSSSAGRTITVAGGPVITTAISKWSGSSGQFSQNGYLTATVSGGLGSGDFTIEMWCYRNTNSNTQMLFNSRTSGTGSDGVDIWYNLEVSTADDRILAGTTVPLTAWTHLAVVRASNVITRYIDGVASGAATRSNNFSGSTFRIGGNPSGNQGYFNGYLADFRFIPGFAVYTSDFTPPTAAFPDS